MKIEDLDRSTEAQIAQVLVDDRSDDRQPEPAYVEAVVRSLVGRLVGTTPDHAVPVDVDRWVDGLDRSDDARGRKWGDWVLEVEDGLRSLPLRIGDDKTYLTRSDVFAQEDPLQKFLAAMLWGFGPTGYGWYRTFTIIDRAGGTGRVRDIVRLLSEVPVPLAAFETWRKGGAAHAWGLNTAFASKLAYFAAYDRMAGKGPLIADMNTAHAVAAVAGIHNTRTSAARYAEYVEWADRMATRFGYKSDDIERALFSIGPSARDAWRRKR